MFNRTDDPIADFQRHDAEQTEWLKKRPKCACCRDHIQQETAVHIYDKWYCDECLDAVRESIGDD